MNARGFRSRCFILKFLYFWNFDMSFFNKATKKSVKLRLLLQGASGSGKTYSSLVLAQSLGKKIALIDTEKGSASLYSDKFDFDVIEMNAPYEVAKFIQAIKEAEKEGYDVLVIDSITHEWQYLLELHSKMDGNSYTNWSKITPVHDKFLNAILTSNLHIIATARSKQEYTLEDQNGKKVPVKKGLGMIQRDGLDYEFTIVFELNENHLAKAPKDRSGIFDGQDFPITTETGQKLLNWLDPSTIQQTK